ncbi:MAG TPA: hypothetical protein PLB91_01690 [Spirochaetales bacterium]|nr:hypothetical protein [Spirochaetales bacterium]HRY55252.1 hypothetical protein [Spirochaetia bacterium]HRZ64203.1 hypothetical protein [Spirochaetia bacterium]
MPVCDVCGKEMRMEDGVILTTAQVTESPRYWGFGFSRKWPSFHEQHPDGAGIATIVAQQADQKTGWLVCETCARMFTYDRQEAKDRVREVLANPDKEYGRATDAKKVMLAALKAWQTLYPDTGAGKDEGSKAKAAGKPKSRSLLIALVVVAALAAAAYFLFGIRP